MYSNTSIVRVTCMTGQNDGTRCLLFCCLQANDKLANSNTATAGNIFFFLKFLVPILDTEFLELELIIHGVFIIGTVWCGVTRRCWTWRCTQRSRIVETAWIECVESAFIDVIGIDGLQCFDSCFTIILQNEDEKKM